MGKKQRAKKRGRRAPRDSASDVAARRQIAEALAPLEPAAQRRVIAGVADQRGITLRRPSLDDVIRAGGETYERRGDQLIQRLLREPTSENLAQFLAAPADPNVSPATRQAIAATMRFGLRGEAAPSSEPSVCDVCGARGLRWRYPVEPWPDQLVAEINKSFNVRDIRRDTAHWFSCDRCSALIEKDDRQALYRLAAAGMDAALAGQTDTDPEAVATRRAMRAAVEARLTDFFLHRRGPRQPIDTPLRALTSFNAAENNEDDPVVCDVCGSQDVRWQFPIKPWRDRSIRPSWLACARCGRLIDKGDRQTLHRLTRARLEQSFATDPADEPMRTQLRQGLAIRLDDFLANRQGSRRRYLGTTDDAPLPDVGPYSEALLAQLQLRDFWRTPSAIDRLTHARSETGAGIALDALVTFAGWTADTLDRAPTYYISPQIAEFLVGSAPAVPADAVFVPEDLPAASGFLYLAQPMATPCSDPDGHQERPGDPVAKSKPTPYTVHSPAFHNIRAIGWSYGPEGSAVRRRTPLVDTNGATAELLDIEGICQVWIYVDSRASGPTFRDHFMWPEGSRVDAPMRLLAESDGEAPLTNERSSTVLDPVRRLLLSAWSFISEQVAEEARRRPNSLTRKRLEREGRQQEARRAIRIVYLRRETHPGQSPQRESAAGREYHWLWWRRLHKRMVPYGPRNMEPRPRRLRWIKPRICGPADRSKWASLELKPTRAIYAVVK